MAEVAQVLTAETAARAVQVEMVTQDKHKTYL